MIKWVLIRCFWDVKNNNVLALASEVKSFLKCFSCFSWSFKCFSWSFMCLSRALLVCSSLETTWTYVSTALDCWASVRSWILDSTAFTLESKALKTWSHFSQYQCIPFFLIVSRSFTSRSTHFRWNQLRHVSHSEK